MEQYTEEIVKLHKEQNPELYAQELKKFLASVDRIEKECWEAWESSKKAGNPNPEFLILLQDSLREKVKVIGAYVPK